MMWKTLIIIGFSIQRIRSNQDELGNETNTSQTNVSCYDSNGNLDTGQNACFQCFDKRQVILPHKVCDGVIDCYDMSDECLCENMKIRNDICDVLYNPKIDINSICAKITGNINCGNGVCIDRSKVCDDTEDCPNGIDESFCFKEQNDGSGDQPSDLSKTVFCNQTISGNQTYDEENKQICTYDQFYCPSSDTVTNSTISVIPRFKVHDGSQDCPDGIDECNESEKSFSSQTEMISITFLTIMLWILGIAAFIGNLSVICFTICVCRSYRKKLHVISRCHHLLVFNLSVADFLMSIYLLATAIQGVRFSGNYCFEDLSWRSSVTCSALGSIAFISSEMSVAIMTIMAGFRFATIYKPIETFYSLKTEKIVRFLVVFSWLLSIAIGILPLLGPIMHSFTPYAAVSCPIYNSSVLDIRTMSETSEKVLTYFKRSNISSAVSLPQNAVTITDIEIIHTIICPRSIKPRWLGFYGQNSACLPRLFAKTTEAAWEYSVAFIVYNFVAFFLMVIFYVMIVKIALKNSRELGQSNGIPQCRLQKRVTRLLVTDFLCWVPICIIGFIYLSGVIINPIVFAVCGIVLLPLNSALNPILYSGFIDIACKTMQKWRGGVSRSTFKGDPNQTSSM